jgi:D-arabinan exo alpha-(1,3)/(1,5)-arabinofuranosidase (non-reducing end)
MFENKSIMRKEIGFCIFMLSLLAIFSQCHRPDQAVNMGTLLDEMVDLERLTALPDKSYKNVQFSSYDRRSKSPSDSAWFANEDGFGNEPIPGFQQVLKQPDANGIGEYLICDIQNPGAILRLWTAGISGMIRLYIDSTDTPFYEGDAKDFFWKTPEALSGSNIKMDYSNSFRQFDAMYFPITFSKRCRIEWIGDLKEIHFYHIGVRIYDSNVKVESANVRDLYKYAAKLEEVNHLLRVSKCKQKYVKSIQNKELSISSGSKCLLYSLSGSQAIDYFSIRINAEDIENALRQTLLTIYFDNSSVPQVESPVGDFFGAAPGLNPFHSLPFSVEDDSTMICRFIMPFQHAVKIEISNNSKSTISVKGGIGTMKYDWVNSKSMHFRARWKIDHNLTAENINDGSNENYDILYLMAMGQGRLVGTATYIYNPSNVPTSWGNWWGEGDEKIFTDNDSFPSFFGTGSEDYFNYSWSSARIFSYPYCGQPRNDGPGNRGYVSNFRWHIPDDILFQDKLAFYMELGHHGHVPGFSYGRIVYFYAIPSLIDNYSKISGSDIAEISYQNWEPLAYLGSSGNRFIQAELLIPNGLTSSIEDGDIWSGGKIVMWKPRRAGDKVKFRLNNMQDSYKTNIGFTMAHGPDGGKILISVNNNVLKFRGNNTISLFEAGRQILDNHFSEQISLLNGINELTIESVDTIPGKRVGIDFIWLQDH